MQNINVNMQNIISILFYEGNTTIRSWWPSACSLFKYTYSYHSFHLSFPFCLQPLPYPFCILPYTWFQHPECVQLHFATSTQHSHQHTNIGHKRQTQKKKTTKKKKMTFWTPGLPYVNDSPDRVGGTQAMSRSAYLPPPKGREGFVPIDDYIRRPTPLRHGGRSSVLLVAVNGLMSRESSLNIRTHDAREAPGRRVTNGRFS